jgi:hypothetical protein
MRDPGRARSVSELLPTAFDSLTIEDVRTILADVGEARESLYFERKRSVSKENLAKSCAAFANTYGGLLVVGIEDATDDLVGIPRVAEPHVWVKDVLRAQLLPLPPYQARWLPLDDSDELGLLLVLVEESSTTPHLLTRRGAIYVRNPGSSDPAPIADQALLLDLVRRGREARDAAVNAAYEMLRWRFNEWPIFTLSLAPTGSTSDPVRDLYRDRERALQLLTEAVGIFDAVRESGSRATVVGPSWTLDSVSVERLVQREFPKEPEFFLDAIILESHGRIMLQRCLRAPSPKEEPERGERHHLFMSADLLGIVPWFGEALRRGRELILSLGGHGDLRLVFDVQGKARYVFYAPSKAETLQHDFRVAYWTRLASEPDIDEGLARQLTEDMLRELNVAVPPEP